MPFYRYGNQNIEFGPGNESFMSNNMEEGAALVAPCSLLLFVPPTAVLPPTQHSYYEMFENNLLQKFHSVSQKYPHPSKCG